MTCLIETMEIQLQIHYTPFQVSPPLMSVAVPITITYVISLDMDHSLCPLGYSAAAAGQPTTSVWRKLRFTLFRAACVIISKINRRARITFCPCFFSCVLHIAALVLLVSCSLLFTTFIVVTVFIIVVIWRLTRIPYVYLKSLPST